MNKYMYVISVMSWMVVSVNAAQQNEPTQQQQNAHAPVDIQSLSREIRELTNKVNVLAFGHACNVVPEEQAHKGSDEQKPYIVERAALDKGNVTIMNSNVFVIGHELKSK